MATNLAEITRDLETAGLRIELGTDFGIYRARRNAQLERGSIYPMFDVACSYVDHTNGFWVCGFDADGELVHTQAVRLLNLMGSTLGNHLSIHRLKYITPDSTPDPEQTHFVGPTALDRVTGRVAYQGDFWLRARGLGGPRSQGMTTRLSRLLLEIVHASWKPDYIFALVPKALAEKGAHLRYGYHHCEPGTWVGPDKQVTEEDYLIWMATDELAHSLDHFVAAKPENVARSLLNVAVGDTRVTPVVRAHD